MDNKLSLKDIFENTTKEGREERNRKLQIVMNEHLDDLRNKGIDIVYQDGNNIIVESKDGLKKYI